MVQHAFGFNMQTIRHINEMQITILFYSNFVGVMLSRLIFFMMTAFLKFSFYFPM